MYNKRKFNKVNDKKVLHKVKKQWVTLSLALFMMIGGGAVATHISANADVNDNQNVQNNVSLKQHNTNQQSNVTYQATQLHNQLVNNSAKNTLRLGSRHGKKLPNAQILKSKFKRSNNRASLQRSGFYNPTKKYGVKFIFNKYAPNDKRAVIPKRLNLKHLNWAKGYFDQNNIQMFGHKKNGWIELNARTARKLLAGLNSHKSNRVRINYVSSQRYGRYTRQLRHYQYWIRHGSQKNRKHNQHSYKTLKSQMKFMRVRNSVKRHSHNVAKQVAQDVPNNNVNYTPNPAIENPNVPTVQSSASNPQSNINVPSKQNIPSPQKPTNVMPITPATPSSSAPTAPASSASVAPTIPATPSVPVQAPTSETPITPVAPQSSNSTQTHSDNTPSDVTPPATVPSDSSDNTHEQQPDATHKYLVPNNNGQIISFSSDGISDVENHQINYRNNDLSDIYNKNNVSGTNPLVHIANSKNLLGYNLNQISDSDGNYSDTWVFSDELTDNKNGKATDNDYNNFNNMLENGYGTDNTHKYLIPDSSNHNITLGNITNDGNYSDYINSDVQSPMFVTIIGNKNVFGYNFDKINNTSNNSDSDAKWVFSDELNNSPKARNNDGQVWNNFINTVDHHYFSSDELKAINSIRSQYNNLEKNENNSNNIYAVKPDLSNHVVGQLTNQFKKDTTDWVNFYRGLYGLSPVTDNPSYDIQAQYGADGCNALGQIQHGLNGMGAKPANISASDWQKGIDATNSSNLYGGGASDPDEIGGYFTDGANLTGNNTGHRAWILDQGLKNIGIGVDNGYGDLYVITPSDTNLNSSDDHNSSFKNLAYPNVGVFPYSDAVSGPWSLYMPNSDEMANIKVSVHDDTTNTMVAVNNTETDSDYGYYNIITYEPNLHDINANHQYTITISGQGIPNGSYTYTTKLFKLNDND